MGRRLVSAFAVARPGASLRNALSLGNYALGMLCKDIPECALDEARARGYADDGEAFTIILIFTDGSGTITDSCHPQPRDAGWAIVVLGRTSSGRLRRIGESFGDVDLPSDREDHIGCPRPTAAMEELTALLWALPSSCYLTTRLHTDIFSDSEHATGVVEGSDKSPTCHWPCSSSQGVATVKHGSCIEFSPTSSEPTRVAGNEVAEAMANTGRVRGPVPCSVPVTPRGA